eukprot:TRINITY_DN13967_c0_g4_i1.p2 TRINITY_DN13967_c0_g4~~TRINITY_DN13967_c0_g4_i1.p2  ORF type:complete len:101 (+),score=22.76 TRINITY_DN13967_c0_g4_i1:572-874(+)
MHKFDWKVLAMNEAEAARRKIESIDDYERLNPKKVEKIMKWFNSYKISQSHEKTALLKGKMLYNAEETIKLIKNGHVNYEELFMGGIKPRNPIWFPPSRR